MNDWLPDIVQFPNVPLKQAKKLMVELLQKEEELEELANKNASLQQGQLGGAWLID